jgi:cytohesin
VIVPIMSTLVKHYELGVFVTEPVVIQSQPQDRPTASNYGAYGIIGVENIAHKPGPIEGNPAPVMAGSQSAKFPWRSVVLSVWITASLILAARLLVTFILGVRLLGRATPLGCERIEKAAHLASVKLGIDKDVNVYSSRDVRSPVIWCWRHRPVLLVPNAAGRFDDGVDWASVLCHELAHWKRWDHISGLLAELVICILPWNPLLWWAKSLLVRFSEQACDDWVVATGRPGTDYAESLLDLTPGGQMAFVPAVVSSKRGLAGRVRRILQDKCSNPRTGVVWALAIIIVTACMATGIAFAQTRPAEPASAAAQEKTTATPTAKDKAAATAALFRAIKTDDIMLVKSAITQGADIEGKNTDAIYLIGDIQSIGCTPLYVAAGVPGANDNLIGLLLEAGANPNTRDSNSQIPLHAAARCWRISVARMLVSADSDVNAADKEGRTPAIIAFELGHYDTFDLMVGSGATVPSEFIAAYKGDLVRIRNLIENGKAQKRFDQGLTLLHAAAAGGHTAIVDLLLTNGLDVSSKTQEGYTALHHAAAGNHREVAELLHAKGADVNAELLHAKGADVNTKPGKVDTPLHWAIRGGHKDMIDWLLAKGANPNADGGDYWATPLHWAIWCGDVDTALLLVSHGGDIHLKTQEYPYSPLFDSVVHGNPAMAEALVSKTGDTKAAKWAPLHATVVSGDIQAVEDLLARGANVNAKSELGSSALHTAAVFGHKDIAELLIEKGADVNTKAESSLWDKGMTALHGSCVKGQKGVAELLIAKGADVNAKSKNGYTPLHIAVTEGYRDVAELFIAKGAYVNTKNNKGETPLSVAKKKGHTEIVELLRKHGAKD